MIYYKHPTAVVESDIIGDGFEIYRTKGCRFSV